MRQREVNLKGLGLAGFLGLMILTPLAHSFAAPNGSSPSDAQASAHAQSCSHTMATTREALIADRSRERATIIEYFKKRNKAVVRQSGSQSSTTLDQGGSDNTVAVVQAGKGNRVVVHQNPTCSTVVISQD